MRKFFPVLFLLLILMLLALPTFTKQSAPRKNLPGADPGYWVVDLATDKYLTHTSVPLSVGDEYITADNSIYRIVKIIQDKAYVKKIQ